MVRFCGILSVFLLFASTSFAGFGSYDSMYSRDSVVAPVQIKEKGIYNLVVSIQFLVEPYDQKVYDSDEYENFIKRLKVEWTGVTINQILQSKEQSVNDLAELKSNIENEIRKLADQLKPKYSVRNNVETVFSISSFFLLEPKTK